MKAFLLFLIALATSFNAHAAFDMHDFSRIPVLHEGRVKPLDTFARVYLKTLSARDEVDGMPAHAWLAEMMFDPDSSWEREVLYIPNPDVLDALGITPKENHRYTFLDVAPRIKESQELIDGLMALPDTSLSIAQKQVIGLYYKTLWMFSMSRSMSLIWPALVMPDPEIAAKLGVTHDAPFTYLDLMSNREKFLALIENVGVKKPEDITLQDGLLLRLGQTLKGLKQNTIGNAFPILARDQVEGWVSPWMEPADSPYLRLWEQLALAWKAQDYRTWERVSVQILDAANAQPENTSSAHLHNLEVHYNTFNFFGLSLWFYGAGMIFLALFVFTKNSAFRTAALTASYGGALLHILGIVLRVFIMARPPVATIYESIVFAAVVAVILGIILEHIRKDGTGLFSALLSGIVLQFVGTTFAAEGDTMGMLVAVLNTNFWLATHVVTITIGYGCCLVAAALGHVYLANRIIGHDGNKVLKSMLGVSIIALFFTTLGTILGGIWADQSWGRFWGWDPKENGALLIVLWLAFLLHGRLSGLLKPITLSAGMGLTAIVVAVAWFGVNLLGVGLHSYGFIDSVATNLLIYCSAQCVIILTLWAFAIKKVSKA